jgi:GNAT superfamily N-acetyltransferase
MIQIRLATLEDFDQLLVLFRQLWPTKDIVPERLHDVYERVIATPDKRYFCAVSGEKVVALGSMSFKDNLWQEGVIAYVEELVVHKDWRGQGIGSRILEHLTELALEKGCSRIELDSAFHRVEAHKLYERHGLEKRAFLFSRVLNALSSTTR